MAVDVRRLPVAAARSVLRLGFWSAVGTLALALAWFALFLVQLVVLPQGWSGIEEYAARFTSLELANLWPSLALGWVYVSMLAALHSAVPEERRAWSLAGLALGVVYATMATVNYTIQIVAVAPNLRAGQLEGLHLWAGANFHSIFWALALGYGVMALSMLMTAPALDRGPARRFLLLAGASAPFQFGFGLFGWPSWVGIPGTMLWLVGLAGACIAIARRFRTMLHPA